MPPVISCNVPQPLQCNNEVVYGNGLHVLVHACGPNYVFVHILCFCFVCVCVFYSNNDSVCLCLGI